MHIPRRFLPPLILLQAFEAAARLESFTAAAEELELTQSAVSRQIGKLEDILGWPLFFRERQKVQLTVAGETYAREVREALRRISTATLGFKANPMGVTLNLAILPTFASRWLLPRLGNFRDRHPQIAINLQTVTTTFDFGAHTFDAAIHYGTDQWPDADLARLFGEIVIPVCNPQFLAHHAIATVDDLKQVPLLHLASRPGAWEQWFAAMDAPTPYLDGMLLDQFSHTTEAAKTGLGVALMPKFLIEPELASGELVIALDRPARSEGAYYLAWPGTRAAHRPLMIFREWLLEQSARVEWEQQPETIGGADQHHNGKAAAA